MTQSSSFKTQYSTEDSGKVLYDERTNGIDEIEKLIAIIDQVLANPKITDEITKTVNELKYRVEALRFSDMPLDELHEKIKSYSRIKIGSEKFIPLSSFIKKGQSVVVSSQDEYLQQIEKMRKNTISNLNNLLIFEEGDPTLESLFNLLNDLENQQEVSLVKEQMAKIKADGMIKHYDQIKFNFLQKWLEPFQAKFKKPVAEMDFQEVQHVLQQVQDLKKRSLAQIGIKLVADNHDSFAAYNCQMHPIMNGEKTDFWGLPEYRDEFIALVKQVINYFSFKLENRYLIFQSEDQTFTYLLGFPDDVLEKQKKMKTGKIGMIPHLKVFFGSGDNNFKELNKADLEKPAEFYRILKTSVVPFLVGVAKIIEFDLSQGFRDAFEMWS